MESALTRQPFSTRRSTFHPILGMLAGAILAMIVAIALGYLTLRLRGIYFSITTIAFAEALSVIWLMTPGVTGGAMGVSTPPLFGGNREHAYYLILGILALVLFVVWLIESSRLNFAFTAIRENEEVANVMGINPTRYKVLAFMISAFFTGFRRVVFTVTTTLILFHTKCLAWASPSPVSSCRSSEVSIPLPGPSSAPS